MIHVRQVRMIYEYSGNHGDNLPNCGGAYRMKTNTIELRIDLTTHQKFLVLFHELVHYLIELLLPVRRFCTVAQKSDFEYAHEQNAFVEVDGASQVNYTERWCNRICFSHYAFNEVWDTLWHSYAETLFQRKEAREGDK